MTSSLPGERNTGAPRPRKLLWLLLLLRVAGAAGLTVPAPRFPAGWDSVGLAPPSERLRVVFSLRQSREGLRYLAAELREIADPSNAERYGRWRFFFFDVERRPCFSQLPNEDFGKINMSKEIQLF